MAKCPTCGGYIKDDKKHTFESSRKQIKSAVLAIPEVGNTNIHNHGTPWPGIIVAGFICGVALLFVAWGIGVFLLDRAGFKRPDQSLANGILILLIILPAVGLVSWLLERVPRAIIRELRDWSLSEKEIDLQRWKIQALAGQASVPTAANLTEADVRFVRVVKQVVGAAYVYAATKGPYKAKEPRPWSRDVAKETILLWDGKKIGWTDANRLGKYVIDNEIILDGQLNQGKYPTMDAVNDLLDKEFTRPIVVGNLKTA